MKQLNSPLISVLMGVYYQKPDISFLERSVLSILDQTFSDLELLICDDGSAASASRYLDSLIQQDDRIRLIRPGRCFHLAEKLNACLAEARGTFLARMDDDDYSYPERFSKQVDALKSHSEIAFIGTNAQLFCNGKPAGKRALPEWPNIDDFLFTQPYIHPALMFRREALLSVGGYSESPICILCEDYDLLLRLYAKGYQGKNLQEELLIYTLPGTAKGSRKIWHRWNETVTRYRRFRELGILPKAFPYVIKPLAVGLIPEPVLKRIKGYYHDT